MFALLLVWQFLDSFLSCLAVFYQCVSMSMVWHVFDGFLSFLAVFYQCVIKSMVQQVFDGFLSFCQYVCAVAVFYQCVSMSMVWQVFDWFLSTCHYVGGVAVSRRLSINLSMCWWCGSFQTVFCQCVRFQPFYAGDFAYLSFTASWDTMTGM